MAQFYVTTGFVEVNSVDLTDHVKSYSVDLRKDQIDDTALQTATGSEAHSFLAGLENNEITIEFQQDFDSGKVDATLHAMWAAGVSQTIKVRAAVGTGSPESTNPEYQIDCQLLDYTPMSGAIGDEALTSVTFLGTSIATRQVS